MRYAYDLTHVDGMADALADYAGWNPSRAPVMLEPFMPFLPEEILGPKFSETVLAMVRRFWTESAETVSAQKITAIEFIEMGKKIGICKLNIKLHPEAGKAISQHLEGFPHRMSYDPTGAAMVEVSYHHAL